MTARVSTWEGVIPGSRHYFLAAGRIRRKFQSRHEARWFCERRGIDASFPPFPIRRNPPREGD